MPGQPFQYCAPARLGAEGGGPGAVESGELPDRWLDQTLAEVHLPLRRHEPRRMVGEAR